MGEDRTEEQLLNELTAMRQRVAELETTALENARLLEQAREEIVERRRTEETLRRLQELNQGIVQNMAEGIVVEDAEGIITFVNPAASTLLGYEVEDLVGQHWTVVIPPDQQPIAAAANERRARGQSDRYELQVIRKDGQRVPIQTSGSPRFDPHTGRFAGTLAVFTDLTERARVEEELRKHRNRLEELVKERTAALTEANAHLQQEMAERERVEAERERLLAAERQRADALEALRTTMADITAELELSALLEAIVERAAGLLNATGGELGLYDENSQEIRIVISHNLGEGYVGASHKLGEGAMGRVAETGEALIVEDYHIWEGRAPQYADVQIHASVAAPLKVRGRLVGVVTIATTNPDRQFGPADLHLLSLFAQQAAIAIANARLFKETHIRAEELAVLNELGQAFTAQLSVERVLDEVYRGVSRLLDTTNFYIGLYDPEKGEINFPINVSESLLDRQITVLPVDQGLTGYIIRNRTSVLTEENLAVRLAEMGVELVGEPALSYLGVPLMIGKRVLGMMAIQSYTTPRLYDEHDRDLLVSIASQAAIAIENARLFDQAQREITERVRAEAELRRYQEHLEELVAERTAELGDSEARYRTLFDGVPVGLYRTTRAGEFVDTNLAMVQMLGFPSREELLASNAADLYVNPEDRTRLIELVEREGVLRDFETQLHRYGGEVFWVSLTLRAVKADQAQVVYYEGSLEDITERKRAQAELRKYQEHLEELVAERTAELQKSEERYRTLFDGVPVGLYQTTPEGQVLDINPATAHMLGFPSREEALAMADTGDLYVDPQERIHWQALMEHEGVVRDFETRFYRHDGTVIWVNDTARAVKDEQGHVLYYDGSLEDITERKEFEGEIRRQKEYYEGLFVNSPVAIVTVDLEGNVFSWNPSAERLFGYTQAEAIGRNVDDLVAKDESIRAEAVRFTDSFLADPAGFRDLLRAEGYPDLLDDSGRVQFTTKRTRKDGTLVDVEVLGLPVKVTVAEEDVGFIVIYNDISDLQKARREAEAASQAKSAFLANMSHELRTPLNAILGFTQLMDRDPNLTAQQQENLRIINRSGEHLLSLINDVLEMSKIEAGRVTLQEKSFDLYHLLDGLEEMFRLRAEEKGLTLSFDQAEDVPQYVRTDEGKLRQVLSNLLGNAVKFTQQGGVALRVMALRYLQERATMRFEVEDTGPGIAPDELAVVFDPFVQATSEQAFQEGTGLGLSISQQYARLLGGDITVSSELERGSLFKFDVRVGLADVTEVQVARLAAQVIGLEPGQAVYRLLVAEDRETNRQLLVKLLEPLGFEVREAANGQEAIEVWEQWQPHLILMDMRMPVIDGYEATRRIKATPRGEATVIIALTASAFEEDRERVLAEGCDDFLRKPFRKDEIFEMLAKYLGVRFVYDEAQPLPALAQPAEASASLAGAVAALPADWVADLQQATIKADLNLILTLVDQIRGETPALADTLADWAHNFEYKRILSLVEQAGG